MNFATLHPIHPIGLEREILAMPTAYQQQTVGMIPAIKEYFTREAYPDLHDHPPKHFKPDQCAKYALGIRFPANEYKYGYYRANGPDGVPTDAYIRMIGILPAAVKPIGTILDVRGYGHALEHDYARTADFLDAGFAVFTPDRLEHGLSSRMDPRNPAFRSAHVFVENTRQALEIVAKEVGEKWAPSPLYAIGSSLGGAQLIGAMAKAQANYGVRAMVLDSPLLTLGTDYPKNTRRLMTLLRLGLETFPDFCAERKAFYPLRSRTKRTAAMTDAEFERLTRYMEAFGPRVHPSAMWNLEALLAENHAALPGLARANILPPTMLTVARNDTQVDPSENERIFRALPLRDNEVRYVEYHNAFLGRNDPHLVPDVVEFFRERGAK